MLAATLVSLASLPVVIRSLAHGDGPEQQAKEPEPNGAAKQGNGQTPASAPDIQPGLAP